MQSRSSVAKTFAFDVMRVESGGRSRRRIRQTDIGFKQLPLDRNNTKTEASRKARDAKEQMQKLVCVKSVYFCLLFAFFVSTFYCFVDCFTSFLSFIFRSLSTSACLLFLCRRFLLGSQCETRRRRRRATDHTNEHMTQTPVDVVRDRVSECVSG